jgi:hypothetical protein
MIGYRVWSIACLPDGSGPYLLRSPWRGTVWYGRDLEADGAPTADNVQGVYSRSRYGDRPIEPRMTLVHGLIRCSGVVVEHEDGTLRAEHAEIVSLGLSGRRGPWTSLLARPGHGMLIATHDLAPTEAPRREVMPEEVFAELLRTYQADTLSAWPWEAQ